MNTDKTNVRRGRSPAPTGREPRRGFFRPATSLALLLLAASLAACDTAPARPVLEGGSQVELRSIQTRAFETDDREQTLRTVIATLQDLGFVIDKADATLGAVSATKLDGYELRMTVTVRECPIPDGAGGQPGDLPGFLHRTGEVDVSGHASGRLMRRNRTPVQVDRSVGRLRLPEHLYQVIRPRL
jgi:hypothetical protein